MRTRYFATLVVIPTLALCSCGMPEVEQATDSTSSLLPQSTQSEPTNFDEIINQFPPLDHEIPDSAAAPVGACVALSGTRTSPSLSVVACGSPQNGYKIIQVVATPAECVVDADQIFYTNPPEGQWTACLDYAWSNADCLSISKITAVRVRCDDTTIPRREKPISVLIDVADAEECGEGGFTHRVREFTVCTETQR